MESLVLRDAEWLLQFDRFSSSLRAINPVKTLILLRSGTRTCSTLRSRRIGIVNLTVFFLPIILKNRFKQERGCMCLMEALSSHAQTLETLHCDSGPHTLPFPPPQQEGHPRTCYVAVRTLSLVCDSSSRAHSDLASLAKTFPNVTSLTLMCNPYKSPFVFRTPISQFLPDWEKPNLEREGCWTVLAQCSGDLASLYDTGLRVTCHIVNLRVQDIVDFENLAMLNTVIATTRPKCLRVRVDRLDALRGIIAALHTPEFRALETMHIFLGYMARSCTTSMFPLPGH